MRELIEAGVEPLRDFIAALHSKLLVAGLRRQREARGCAAPGQSFRVEYVSVT